jgi:hypothetical protein
MAMLSQSQPQDELKVTALGSIRLSFSTLTVLVVLRGICDFLLLLKRDSFL